MKRLMGLRVACLLMWVGSSVRAAGAPDFPPGVFDDGNRYSLKDLQGKAVVLFFYEQDCPRCRGLIPERNKIVEKYADKPIKFIAVAASDTLNEARIYRRSTSLEMPVFADSLGLMEKRYGTKISLQNIYQFRIIGPTGAIEGSSMDSEAIDKVLARVKWKYRDGGYDPKLDAAVDRLEWGLYVDGVKLLRPFLKNSKKEVAESARKLYDAVKAEGAQWLEEADKALAQENPVEAYDLYLKTSNVFAGEDLGKKAAEALKKLSAAPAVKEELAARRMYDQLCAGSTGSSGRDKEAAAEFANQIARKYPKTPTGAKAAQIVKELEG